MVEVGISSDDLPQTLKEVLEFYDQEVENRPAVLTTMIEPMLMLSWTRDRGAIGLALPANI